MIWRARIFLFLFAGPAFPLYAQAHLDLTVYPYAGVAYGPGPEWKVVLSETGLAVYERLLM